MQTISNLSQTSAIQSESQQKRPSQIWAGSNRKQK